MVDLQNPTSQFHSYQPPDATPHTESDTSGHWGMLRKVGLNDAKIASVRDSMHNVNLGGAWNKTREYARMNPGKFLGGMAALIIGAGMLSARGSRKRHHRDMDPIK